MATAKKTKHFSVGEPATKQAVPRSRAQPEPPKPSKTTAARKKPAAMKPASKKTAPENRGAERPAAVTDEGARLILKELRAIRDMLGRHDQMLAQITERLITPEAPARDRSKAEARTSDARGAPDVQDQETGELP